VGIREEGKIVKMQTVNGETFIMKTEGLGAACQALEDSKRQQNRKPIILLSDSACFLSSSQKWTGEGKSPSMHGNSDADIMRKIVQLLRERIDQVSSQFSSR